MPDARARRRPLTSLAAVTLGLALLALLSPAQRRGVPGLPRRVAARDRGRDRGAARSPALDRQRAASGQCRRGDQHADRGRLSSTPRSWQGRRSDSWSPDGSQWTSFATRLRWSASRSASNGGVRCLLRWPMRRSCCCSSSSRALALTWVVALAGALRIAGIAWNIVVAPVYDVSEAHRECDQRAWPRRRARGGRDGGGDRVGSAGPCADRPRVDSGIHRHAVRHSHWPDGQRRHAAGPHFSRGGCPR